MGSSNGHQSAVGHDPVSDATGHAGRPVVALLTLRRGLQVEVVGAPGAYAALLCTEGARDAGVEIGQGATVQAARAAAAALCRTFADALDAGE